MGELQPETIQDLLEELEEEEPGTEVRAKEDSPPASDEAAQHLARAFTLEDDDEYDKALEECEAARRLDPALAGAHNLQGVILEDLGREREAVLAYREALRLEPRFDSARENPQAVGQLATRSLDTTWRVASHLEWFSSLYLSSGV